MGKLTAIEQSNLELLENKIEHCLQSFHEMGLALRRIRDEELYREQFRSFESYCEERWKIGKKRAYQLMWSSETMEVLTESTPVDMPLPDCEGQIRSLHNLPAEQQTQAWQAATQVSDRPTGQQVERAVTAVKQPKQLAVGQRVAVQNPSSPYFGNLVTILESDGIIVQARTESGQTVPLLSSEIKPEPERGEVKASPTKSNYAAVVQAQWEIERARSLALEVELRKIIGLIERGVDRGKLVAATKKAKSLLGTESIS